MITLHIHDTRIMCGIAVRQAPRKFGSRGMFAGLSCSHTVRRDADRPLLAVMKEGKPSRDIGRFHNKYCPKPAECTTTWPQGDGCAPPHRKRRRCVPRAMSEVPERGVFDDFLLLQPSCWLHLNPPGCDAICNVGSWYKQRPIIWNSRLEQFPVARTPDDM
jgi:hypothetical protein